MRKRLLVAVALSIVSMLCGYSYLSDVSSSLSGGRKVGVYVAAQEIKPGTRLTKDLLGVREIPESYLHPEAIAAGPAEEARLLDRPVLQKLASGQTLLWSSFDVQQAPQKLSNGVPRRQRAITVPVDLTGGFAGMLRPGDHVDVIGTFSHGQGDSTTVTLIQNVAVLATGEQRQSSDALSGHGFNSVTLAVDLSEAELLTFAHQRGTIAFALRGEGDFETVTDISEKNFADVFDKTRREIEYQRRETSRAQSPVATAAKSGRAR